jgi:hypothetical protein
MIEKAIFAAFSFSIYAIRARQSNGTLYTLSMNYGKSAAKFIVIQKMIVVKEVTFSLNQVERRYT